MNTKIIILVIISLCLAIIANAQPLPPTTPSGSPVPAEGLLALLPMALTALGIVKLKRKK